MRLDWEIRGDNLVIQLIDDDDQGGIIESEISIPRSVLASGALAGNAEAGRKCDWCGEPQIAPGGGE